MRLNEEDEDMYHPELKPLSEAQLDTLQWAKDFMDRYERKHR